MVYDWAAVVPAAAAAAGAEMEGITGSVEQEKCRRSPGAIEPSVVVVVSWFVVRNGLCKEFSNHSQ
jgi:hypothetical protein